MSYLLDTSILSASSKRRPPIRILRWLEEHEDQSFISVVSLAELQFGIETSVDPQFRTSLEDWLTKLRSQFAHALLGLSEPVLVEWKRLLAELKMKNRTVSFADSLLAATAREYKLRVVTTNIRDFEPSGVEIVDLRYG